MKKGGRRGGAHLRLEEPRTIFEKEDIEWPESGGSGRGLSNEGSTENMNFGNVCLGPWSFQGEKGCSRTGLPILW